MKKIFFIISAIFIFSNFSLSVHAGEFDSVKNQAEHNNTGNEVFINYTGGKNYTYIERTDLRRYDNGKYTGLVSREVRSFIIQTDEDSNGVFYDGSFFVDEGTKRAAVSVFAEISDSIESSFKILNDGTIVMIKDNGYPTFRSFPSYPKKNIAPGTKWQAKAIRCADPLNKGIVTKIPFYVEYTYSGEQEWNGETVFLVTARWATRYGAKFFIDFGGDKDLVEAQGNHSATIYISKKTGAAIVIRDSVDETFTYSDGNKISFKGTINLFTKYPPTINQEKLLPVIQRVAKLSDEQIEQIAKPVNESKNIAPDFKTSTEPDITSKPQVASADLKRNTTSANSKPDVTPSSSKPSLSSKTKNKASDTTAPSESDNSATKIDVEKTSLGIKLTLPNLQFKPDSKELLPSERRRLEQIAEILSQTDDAMLLVEGHSASTGNKTGELELSKERAAVIAKELSNRGIASARFIIKACGSDNPIADNSTKEGMAKNRRVEITILE